MRYLLLLLLVGCSGQNSFKWDNDFLKPSTTRDRYYTNGLEYASTHPDDTGAHTYSVGQLIYTPGNKQATEYLPEDRPYAGYLYSKYAAHYRTDPDTTNTFGVSVGIVGPYAFGEQVQNGVHRLINNRTAKGWDNQVGTEIGIIGIYERQEFHYVSNTVDITSTGGANLGNVFTQVYGAARVRVGYNLTPDYISNGPIFPRLPDRISSKDYSVYLFASPLARAVAHNITLDGNTFKDSPSIEKEPMVYEGRLGIGLEVSGYKLIYTWVIQTQEFEGEDGTAEFGNINISWGW